MEKNRRIYFIAGFITILLALSYFMLTFTRTEYINIIAGKETGVIIDAFGSEIVLSQKDKVIKVNGKLSNEYKVDANKKLSFCSEKEGVFDFTVNILNRVPIKHIKVNVLPDSQLYTGGELIGIKLDTSGVIAVGFEDISAADNKRLSPAKEAGIREGDIVKVINGTEVNKASEVKELLNVLDRENVEIIVSRDNTQLSFIITPIKDINDDTYKIGLWVRDNVAGIGTLTFVSEDLNSFAALGHPITDITTGVTVPVNKGQLLSADIVRVVKAETNKPGEIRGIFSASDVVFGSVVKNNDYGIYGDYYGGLDITDADLLPIATQDEIVQGPAEIITTLDNGKKAYDIEIEKVYRQNMKTSKGMLIKVTDKELLDMTGGIVQGMSGSPIIQNGKIIGAVTHVLTSDPSKGYGIFIEWMIEDLSNDEF